MKEGLPQLHIELEQPITPEKKAIMEGAHQERQEIVQGSFDRLIKSAYDKVPQSAKSLMSHGLNNLPIIAETKMTAEVIFGKTLSGKELSNNDRILQLVTAALASLSNVLIYYTAHNESVAAGLGAAVARGVAWVPYLYLAGDEAFDNLKNIAEKCNLPKVKVFIEKAEKFKVKIQERAAKDKLKEEEKI